MENTFITEPCRRAILTLAQGYDKEIISSTEEINILESSKRRLENGGKKFELQSGSEKRILEMIQVSDDPKMTIIDGFMTESETKAILELCHDRWERCGTSMLDTSNKKQSMSKLTSSRTNERVCFNQRTPRSSLVSLLEGRMAILMDVIPMNIEFMTVLKYSPLEIFKLHHDGDFRAQSCIIYLNDVVDSGGDTVFPFLNMNFQPRLGRAVMWSNCDKDGNMDYRMLHAALPPHEGTTKIPSIYIKKYFTVSVCAHPSRSADMGGIRASDGSKRKTRGIGLKLRPDGAADDDHLERLVNDATREWQRRRVIEARALKEYVANGRDIQVKRESREVKIFPPVTISWRRSGVLSEGPDRDIEVPDRSEGVVESLSSSSVSYEESSDAGIGIDAPIDAPISTSGKEGESIVKRELRLPTLAAKLDHKNDSRPLNRAVFRSAGLEVKGYRKRKECGRTRLRRKYDKVNAHRAKTVMKEDNKSGTRRKEGDLPKVVRSRKLQ